MRNRVLAAVVGMLALAACGGNDDNEPQAKPAETTVAPTTTAPPTTVASRCEKVSRALLDGIAEGLTVTGGGSLRNGYAVKSNDFSKVYMVAADIQGAGMEGTGEVGVWATNSLELGGLIFAVDSFAKQFSDWGHGDETDANITPSSDGVSEAKECASK
jgi:hypothetical protein